MMFLTKPVLLAFSLMAATVACAQTPPPAAPALQVEHAWARTSVQGQTGTGAFMRLTAREPLTLLGADTPAAGVTEVHEMKMEGDVMKMRAIPSLPLPVGKPVELKPGGHHLMLMDLKAPLQQGTSIPVTLRLRDASGAERRVELQVPVSARSPSPGAAMRMDQHKH